MAQVRRPHVHPQARRVPQDAGDGEADCQPGPALALTPRRLLTGIRTGVSMRAAKPLHVSHKVGRDDRVASIIAGPVVEYWSARIIDWHGRAPTLGRVVFRPRIPRIPGGRGPATENRRPQRVGPAG